MLGFQIFDPQYKYIPHNLTITNSKNLSLEYLQRGNFKRIDTGDSTISSVYEPPPLELYTKFTRNEYFVAFWGIIFLQCVSIFIIDKILVKNIPQSATFWERITHSIVKSHFPFPFTNWHEAIGDCQDHIKRQRTAQYEVLVTMSVNLIFNMVLLIPLVILCKSFLHNDLKLI